MKHLIETIDSSSLPIVEYDRIILNSTTNDVIVGGGVVYEVMPSSYIYNEADHKYYQKLVAYGKPTEIDDIDLNSQWVSDTTDDEYSYFKSGSYEADLPFSQCKVTWTNLSSITFKYMSSSSIDKGGLVVGNLDGEKFTSQSSDDDIYLSTVGTTPGTYNEFTIVCDEGEHHIWFCYIKNDGATDKDSGFIGVPKSVLQTIDVKQGSELPTEYKSGGISAEGGKTYNISFNNVTLPNGSNIVPSYEDFEKTEKTINYEYVNLGLKSGTLWATCNVGASSETEDGVYFQWGETSGISKTLLGKYSNENYDWGSYIHCNGYSDTLRKYNNEGHYGTVDNKTTLESVDDAATQVMGSDWRMPTEDEMEELRGNTINKWVKDFNGSGVNGMKFISKTDTSKYIFIPAAGICDNGDVWNVGIHGRVWSSSLYTNDTTSANGLGFDSDGSGVGAYGGRSQGFSVRGVRN